MQQRREAKTQKINDLIKVRNEEKRVRDAASIAASKEQETCAKQAEMDAINDRIRSSRARSRKLSAVEEL